MDLPTSISGSRGTAASAVSLTITDNLMIDSHTVTDEDIFRVKVTYTDGQGYENIAFSTFRSRSRDKDFRVRTRAFLEGPLLRR